MVLALAVVLGACAVRRPYEAPQPAAPELRQATGDHVEARPYDARWWHEFDDPVPTALEEAALPANRDLHAAAARVDQARALFDDQRLDRFPRVPVGASVERREQAFPGFTDGRIRATTYRAGLEAFWEADVFGAVRSSIRAAEASAEAFEASLADVQVIVAADVARRYFELRGLQRQLAVAERNLANQRETLRLTEARRAAGIGEEQDVASALARVAAIERRCRRCGGARRARARAGRAGGRAAGRAGDRPRRRRCRRSPRRCRSARRPTCCRVPTCAGPSGCWRWPTRGRRRRQPFPRVSIRGFSA